jgi:NADH dehydrogenase
MKSLEDALSLCNAILSALERAADTLDQNERGRLLTFVLVGAGPTGVEMAGAIAELARDFLAHDLSLSGRRARIMLVDAGSRVLPEFAPDLSTYAARALTTLGVEIRTGKRVTGVKEGEVELEGETLQAGTIIWAAGTEATPVAAWLGVEPGHGGRVGVDGRLRLPGHPCVAVIGDAALVTGPDGKPLPGLASVAKQQGRYAAASILRRVRGQPAPAHFRYRDYGTLATIGRNKAVAELGSVHLTGRPAWLVWAGAHILFLISFRNRLLVSVQWLLAYLTNRRSAGLIVGPEPISGQPPVANPG